MKKVSISKFLCTVTVAVTTAIIPFGLVSSMPITANAASNSFWMKLFSVIEEPKSPLSDSTSPDITGEPIPEDQVPGSLVTNDSITGDPIPANHEKRVEDYTLYWQNFNKNTIENDPDCYTSIVVPDGQSLHIDAISLYHYNDAQGAEPGVVYLLTESKKLIESWNATGNGEDDFYWNVFPDIDLSPGTYIIECSDNTTWSCNEDSNYSGFTQIYGYLH